jgi:glycosyltransferase involved in cell wall biosynthesis
MVAPTPFFADRGCHVRILGEVRALQAAGCEVTLCTYHHGRDIDGVRTVRIPNVPGYRKLTAGPSNAKYLADPLLLLRSLTAALGERPDVIHGHLHEGALIGRILRKLLAVPLVFDYQGSLTDELSSHGYLDPSGARARVFGELETWIDTGADAVAASTTRASATLRDRYPSTRVRTVLDGVDTDEFRPLPADQRAGIRERFGVAPDAQLAIYVGVLADYQGIDLVLDHIAAVLREHPRLQVLFAGYPETEYRRQADELGLAGRVLFPGRVPFDETRALTAAADVGITAKLSATEGNLKIYNYLACGLPVVAFDNVVNREILGDLGVYAPQGDGASFVRRIGEILDDPDRLADLGRRGRAHAVDQLSWHRAASDLIELYGTVLADGTPAYR